MDPGLLTTSTYDPGLTDGQTYYYVVSALTQYGESANSVEVPATPVKDGTTHEPENAIVANGGGIWTCSLCSGGARVGAVTQGTSITFNSVTVPTTGTYAVRIYDTNGFLPTDWGLPQEPTIDIAANGGSAIVSPPLAYTGSFNVPGLQPLICP